MSIISSDVMVQQVHISCRCYMLHMLHVMMVMFRQRHLSCDSYIGFKVVAFKGTYQGISIDIRSVTFQL